MQRWALILSAYDFQIRYVNTKDFGQVDVLSRLITDFPRANEDVVIAALDVVKQTMQVMTEQLEMLPVTVEEVSQASKEDEILVQVKNFSLSGWPQKAPPECTFIGRAWTPKLRNW